MSRLTLSDFDKTTALDRKLIVIKNCLVDEPTEDNLDLLRTEFKSEVFSPKELVEQYYQAMDFPKYTKVELEAVNLRFMALITKEYNDLKTIDLHTV